jgi:hypothetical protein
MLVYQKSFFEHVPHEYGLIHVQAHLKKGANKSFIDLSGIDAPVMDDGFIYARFLKETEATIDDSG